MKNVKELKEERNQLFKDIYDSKIPKRVPMGVDIPIEVVLEYGGIDLTQGQWELEGIEEIVEKLGNEIYSDTALYGGAFRTPSYYEALKSQSFVMGSNGFIQHPEVMGMLPEEYDYLIEKPYDCIIEKVLPRQYKNLNPEEPGVAMLSFAKAAFAWAGDMEKSMGGLVSINEKFGYSDFSIIGGTPGGFTEAPYDFLADQLRGFKEISIDVRKRPEKVLEACEALYPIVKKAGMPPEITDYCTVGFPLHMPTFMREKDFAKCWWPSFKKLCDDYASMGIRNTLFCEDDWMRYLDYLYELPANTILYFEYGEAKEIKKKLGKKHIITGLYPLTYLKNHTKQECADLAKKYIDELAPGGKHFFTFDKSPLSVTDISFENLNVVMETVRDYGVYSNPGEQIGDIFKKEDYKAEPSRPLVSKYYNTWDQYKEKNPEVSNFAADKLQGLEEMIFGFIITLLI